MPISSTLVKKTSIALFLAAGLATATSASAQSVWDKIKQQTQKGQPAQQKPGQQRAGQQPAQNQAQSNDSGPFTPPPGTKVEPVTMAPFEQGSQFAVSPHGMHVATFSHHGSRQVIIYDGVTGPQFDQLFLEGGGGHPVVFSPDGEHWAYCGANGTTWVVMVDGKEFTRGTENVNGVISTESCRLGFSSNSKHVFYTTALSVSPSLQSFRFAWDGKASPVGASNDLRNYVFSPDGDHVAYFITEPTNAGTAPARLFVDTKQAPYAAGSPQWSADSQHLFTMRNVPAQHGSVLELLYDGKPVMRADFIRLFIPPVGDMTVAIPQQNGNPTRQLLVVGGKQVPGSEVLGGQISDVVFSPDGKHYAAHCINANRRHYVFSDGKKGLEYPGLSVLTVAGGKSLGYEVFTADSSKLVYRSYDTSNGQSYMVIGGQESDQIANITDVALAPAGNHVITEGSPLIMIDGKSLPLPNVADPRSSQSSGLSFSPDANHFAFIVRERNGPLLYLDGKPFTAYSPANIGQLSDIGARPYIWSPDGKHLAYLCHSTNPAASSDTYVCLDDKAARLGAGGYANLTFSSDGNHLFWTKAGYQGLVRIFADGKPVFEGYPTTTSGFVKETWQIGNDNNLLVLLQGDSALQRVSIMPSPNTSISTLFSGTGH